MAFSISEPKKQQIFALVFISALALMPIIAVPMPRFLAFGPAIIGLVSFMAYPFIFGARAPLVKSFLYSALAVITLAGISSFWALDPEFARERTIKIALVLLPGTLLFSVAYALPLRLVQPYLWLIFASVGIAAALIIFEKLFGHPLYHLVRGMDMSEKVRKFELNRSSVVAVILFFVALAAVPPNPAHHKKFAAGLCLLFIPMLALTASQSALVAFLLGVCAMFFFPHGKKKAWYALVGLITLLLFVTPWLCMIMFDLIAPMTDGLPWLGRKGANVGARLEIWDYVSRYALQNPLYGFGIEATRAVKEFDSAQIYQNGKTALHPHNFSVQLWIEFGVIGAFLAVRVLNSIIFKIQALDTPQAKVGLATFIACLSVGAMGYGLWQGWWLGLLVLAASLTALITVSKPSASDD